ncbi:unnamed protein product [Gongylonema pulchrum]|uniref:Spectrin repeat-containing domain protein n=1 Tax=Gongylonema pulchrum TaxID=637853 RepID=A0A183CYX2_9BILA|nr:unnamed protein product [Gongylonema pulchrum]
MEEDITKWRPDVEEISNISKQLQQLNITRKGDKLTSAEKQSRQVLDELDYLSEWFSDARDRLMQASAPSVDPDYVKKQLKNQKHMNEDIAVMKARLRDASADAQKIARALGDEASGQNSLLASKIENGRALSMDVAQLSEERLGELEQALALCLEIDQSFEDLHSWLETIENEIEHCPSTFSRQLELLHSIISHKPLMDRFHKNVSALSELCSAEDEMQLQKVAEGLDERFAAARDAVQQRADALETAIEQSSQFTDRLDVILSNLDGAAIQVNLL